MIQNFKVGDVVYVKDQDPRAASPQTVTQTAPLYDGIATVKWIVQMRDDRGGLTWRTADRLALHVPPKPQFVVKAKGGYTEAWSYPTHHTIAGAYVGTYEQRDAAVRAAAVALGYEEAK